MKLSLFTDVGVFYCLCLFSPFVAGRYHSLVIEKESFPDDELVITAWTEDGLVMAARHKKYKHLQVRYCSSFSPIFFQKKEKIEKLPFHLLCAEGDNFFVERNLRG